MINGLEGIPGSGKSYEAVVMHVLPALNAGRRVITNLPLLVQVLEAINPDFTGLVELRMKSRPVLGTWDAEAVDDKGNGVAFTLYEPGQSDPAPSNVSVFGSVWDYYSDWKHPVTGIGPLFIVDEAHLALPSIGTSQEVIEWYKLHRHFNADVLLCTQSFRDLNQPVARLLAILIKCRKADILGKPKSYIRKVHAGYRGAVISTEERKYEPQYFSLYRSHTQGNSVGEALASDVAPLSVKLKRVTWLFWLVSLALIAAMFWPRSKNKALPVVAAAASSSVAPVSVIRPPAPSPIVDPPRVPASAVDVPSAAASEPADPNPDPLAGKSVHVTGWLKNAAGGVYTFTVSFGGRRIFDVTAAELVEAGYAWTPLSQCMGYLTFKKSTRPVTCDAPSLATGSTSAPVVMDFNSGKRSGEGQPATQL